MKMIPWASHGLQMAAGPSIHLHFGRRLRRRTQPGHWVLSPRHIPRHFLRPRRGSNCPSGAEALETVYCLLPVLASEAKGSTRVLERECGVRHGRTTGGKCPAAEGFDGVLRLPLVRAASCVFVAFAKAPPHGAACIGRWGTCDGPSPCRYSEVVFDITLPAEATVLVDLNRSGVRKVPRWPHPEVTPTCFLRPEQSEKHQVWQYFWRRQLGRPRPRHESLPILTLRHMPHMLKLKRGPSRRQTSL